MIRSIRFVLFLCIACILVLNGGCGAGPADKPAEVPIVLGYSQLGDESTWRTQNTRSIIDAAKAAGVQIMFDDAMQKPENQIKAIRSFIAYKVDVIAFSPLVETGWDTVLSEAKAAGIPVIIVDRMIDTKNDSFYRTAIISDFYLEGRRAGEFLMKKYKDVNHTINIVEIAGTADSTPAIGRHDGFMDVLQSDPKFQVIFSQDGDFMLSKGREIMRQVLELFDPDEIDVLYSHNDDMTFGAIEVMQENGIEPGKDIVTISVDATQRIVDYLKAGQVNCVIECNPNSGPQVMDLAKRIAAGEDVQKKIYIPEQVFDENTDFTTIADRGY